MRPLLLLVASVSLVLVSAAIVLACCAAAPSGKPVVNADQTVIIIWDADKQMQHFIRKASFASGAEDVGFIVPTPNQPELASRATTPSRICRV